MCCHTGAETAEVVPTPQVAPVAAQPPQVAPVAAPPPTADSLLGDLLMDIPAGPTAAPVPQAPAGMIFSPVPTF